MTSSELLDCAADPVDAARALGPLIDEHREALARGPDLPAPVAEALKRAGLAQLWLPEALGGPELPPLEFFHAIEALAELDGAVAWCAMLSSSSSRIAGLMPAGPMRRALAGGGPFGFSGSGLPSGTATREGDGWRVEGRWSWASFCRHSTHTFLMCAEHEGGVPRRAEDGRPALRGVVLPAAQVRVLGDWDGGGLRSSGSHDVAIEGAWVPDDCTTGLDFEGRQPGPLYQLPMATAFAVAALGVPLGVAAGSVADLIALARDKVPAHGAAPLRDQEYVQLEVARAKTRLNAARALAVEAIGTLWDSATAGRPASVEEQALVRMACWNAGDAGKDVVGRMYAAAGSGAVREGSRFAARLRDVHAAGQHLNFATRMTTAPGRIWLGLEPGTPMI